MKNSKKEKICPVSDKCGGCNYIETGYDDQLEIKRKKLDTLLKEFGGCKSVTPMENKYYYRNKVHAVFFQKKDRTVVSGIFREGTHDIIPVADCPLENKEARSIVNTVTQLIRSFKVPLYNEDTGKGLLRHLLIRTADGTGEIMVVLVAASVVFPSRKNFAKALMDRQPAIKTVVLNINDKDTNLILGERSITIIGKGYIIDKLMGKTFKLSAESFYQVNHEMTEKLYSRAVELAGLNGNIDENTAESKPYGKGINEKKTVIDAYCGVGTIGIIASDHAGEVIGIELNRMAVKDAVTNAKANHIENITFYCEDSGAFLQKYAAGGKKADVLIMDPPRSGSTKQFIDAIHVLKPERIVYISCGPESLKRDLDYFKRLREYRVETIEGFDMFPWTGHVETVCLMSRVEGK